MKALVAALVSGIAGAAWAALPVYAAPPVYDAKIAPAEIAMGEAAGLTITVSGDAPAIAAPVIPGLRFVPVRQSRRVESVNGVTTSTFSLTYQVTAERAGTYVIAGVAQGVQPLVLKVDAASSGTAPNAPAGAQAAGPPAAAGAPPAAGAPRANAPRASAPPTADGTAFVRLKVPTQQLYVGQSVPVEIQVGTHDGVVASLNGLPTLNGDAFTLEKLSPEPEQRSEEIIDGKPFTVFTWHSVLAAIKPGSLSLRMETPLTVRIPVQRPSARFLDDSTLEDAFDDPAFQVFFGGSTEKDITVSSPPADFTVLELPAEGRPKDFSGAVGQFEISSEVAASRIVVGDPATLRMKVSGTGSFDRVNSPMLKDAPHWKTYQPTAKFAPDGGSAFRGEKIFEQPIVAVDPGDQTLPALSFSYFDPINRRYETARTSPLHVEVHPATALPADPTRVAAAPVTPAPAAPAAARTALQPDHAPASGTASLVPLYYQPAFVALPAAMVLAFPVAWVWLSRRERRSVNAEQPPRKLDLLSDLDRAAAAGNGEEFFVAAQALLQSVLSSRWRIAADAVTAAEVDARLGVDSEVRRLFLLAEEARYAGCRVGGGDLAAWRRVVLSQMQAETAS
jgi:hypothetical protein